MTKMENSMGPTKISSTNFGICFDKDVNHYHKTKLMFKEANFFILYLFIF